MKKMTKAERIYEATRRECKDIITGIHGYSEGQRLSGLVTEEVVCMRTINVIMKLVDKEEHRIRLDEKLGVLSGEKLQLYINVNKMVRSTVENAKKSLKKFLDDLNPDSEYSKWLDERVAAMEAQESAEVEKSETTAPETEQTEFEETAETETAKPETAETDDSGFEYYSVETAYEVDFRDRQNEVFKTYSEAEKTAGDNIILEVDLIVRNDKKAVCEHDKEVFEDETDEIECRCIWYHHNGVKGMIAQDTKRVVKKPETKEKVIENFENIAKAEEKKTQFDFYNVTIGFEVEKFIGTIPADYESLGIYSDYEKAVQAAQAAADEYGAENIYFHTVEIATRNDREVYDRDDYEDFIEERETIKHNWYTLTIVDTGKREHVNLDKPVRLDFEE